MKYTDKIADKLWRNYHGYGTGDAAGNEKTGTAKYNAAKQYTTKLKLYNFVNNKKSTYGGPGLLTQMRGRSHANQLLSAAEKGRRISVGLKKSTKRKRR